MKKNCPRSCVCGPFANNVITSKECKDSNTVQCPLWAKRGECEKNKIYMHKNCAKSCKICKVCADNNRKCSKWAEIGECKANPAYMHVNCKKSCNKCDA
ncbi:putative tyrosinase-like protein tyr-3 [Actinia tenebrosa]|uniref:Tyrosinase-like protein tyr-3 n=1 Tax=Actinia tenebrosa TaxID=6105 RepID=A0A6P8I1F5_ACTTE|nr:putative tyrosinase-like protein tyr-3 [Actinia tenebrosa]